MMNRFDLTPYLNGKYGEEVAKMAKSRFRQQCISAWRPVPSFFSVIITFGLIGLVMLALGIAILSMSAQITEITVDYSSTCNTNPCTVEFEITKTFDSTVHILYELTNFYQNFRTYLKSISTSQLQGNYLTISDIESICDPIVRTSDIGYSTLGNYEKIKNLVAHPCGLVAKSYFNDSFQLFTSSNTQIGISESNIAWNSDKGYYKNSPDYKNTQWVDVENEHFIVWMRRSSTANIRKLWGKIESGLPEGKYYFTITNNYNIEKFSLKKNIILTNTNLLGGRNYTLGSFFVAVGGISFILGIAFIILFKQNSKLKNL